MPRPDPTQFATRAEYKWAYKQWKRSHGGSMLGTIMIAVVFGAISGSQVVLFGLVAAAIVFMLMARRGV